MVMSSPGNNSVVSSTVAPPTLLKLSPNSIDLGYHTMVSVKRFFYPQDVNKNFEFFEGLIAFCKVHKNYVIFEGLGTHVTDLLLSLY